MSAATPRIFVSHSHNDDTFTERLVDDLNRAGASAWMDKRDLGAGNFQERINEALDGCEWFVLVLTRDALASGWVRQEVDAANRLQHQKRIRDLIFIQAGPVEHRELPALWGVFNIFDATADYSAALARTLKAVGLALVWPEQHEVLSHHVPSSTEGVEVGKVYMGVVRRLVDSGAYVEILPGMMGVVNTPNLSNYFVSRPEEVVIEGDEIIAMVIDIDHYGRIYLSRKAALSGEMPSQEELEGMREYWNGRRRGR